MLPVNIILSSWTKTNIGKLSNYVCSIISNYILEWLELIVRVKIDVCVFVFFFFFHCCHFFQIISLSCVFFFVDWLIDWLYIFKYNILVYTSITWVLCSCCCCCCYSLLLLLLLLFIMNDMLSHMLLERGPFDFRFHHSTSAHQIDR